MWLAKHNPQGKWNHFLTPDGSDLQWENVIVWDDGLGRSEIDRRRWLYTAITRAERGLVLLA